jgi:hypothetical protein
MTQNPFKKATRQQSKLRLGLAGPSGSGKTYSALLVAKGMGLKTAVVDTENGSASLYSNIFDFDVVNLSPPYTPERFRELIACAEDAGYECLIIDSITHEWNGAGGCLEINDNLAASKYRGNSWSAWSETTPRHRKFLDAIIQSKLHIIACMRSKTETAQQETNGRKQVVKLGMKAEQRDGFEYELTTVLDIAHDSHLAMPSKDRTGLFSDPEVITEQTGKNLLAWLSDGEREKTAYDKMRDAITEAGQAKNESAMTAYLDAITQRKDAGQISEDECRELHLLAETYRDEEFYNSMKGAATDGAETEAKSA